MAEIIRHEVIAQLSLVTRTGAWRLNDAALLQTTAIRTYSATIVIVRTMIGWPFPDGAAVE
jgi:hypothetical protein